MIPHDSGSMNNHVIGIAESLCRRTIETPRPRVRVNTVLERRGKKNEKHRNTSSYLLDWDRRRLGMCSTVYRRRPTSYQTRLL